MKASLRVLAAAIALVPAAASAGPITSSAQIELPSHEQLGTGRTGHYRCWGAFDAGVTAIRAGFVTDGLDCIKRAAAAGDVRATRAVGLMLLRGEYLARDQDAAASYFYEAALRGDSQSMFLLGQCFARGLGVDSDPELAQFWLNRAAAKGYAPPTS